MTGELYFAYGSNVSPTRMVTRCRFARLIGTGRIDRHRLAFTWRSKTWGGGVADIVFTPGASVWGAIYELRASELDSLDAYEGVPIAYQRRRLTVVSAARSAWSAWAYSVVQKEAHVPPTKAYMQTILDGGREVGLPADYLLALEAIKTVPDVR